MCFIIDIGYHNVRVAKRDIPCYKRLSVYRNKTASPFQNCRYHKNLNSGESVTKTIKKFGFRGDEYMKDYIHIQQRRKQKRERLFPIFLKEQSIIIITATKNMFL